ncbi:expressed unknown protein [Seminavis robusta]|uniref:Uncharacterized protein n=1 Tax=Seminavis robusta TaxID=568900 RepID=A0A9N8EI79_9STRA|nr:expressed unknown protein [Seminavis robusta]|eukprot:Sro1266_g257550.1 n/a (286) ;mRNA; r:3836-5042
MNSKDGLGSYGQVNQGDEMGVSLVAPSPEEVAKPASAVPMIEIMAPATLMEGYQLDTQVGDRVVTITIPPGGVEKGQKFSVPMSPTNAAATSTPKMTVPVGHWKDGLCDCCTYGMCHAHCCISWWCHALAAGQVISRLQLNWLGKTTNSHAEKASAFTTLFTISMTYFSVKIGLFLIIMSMMPEDPEEPPPDSIAPFAMMSDIVNYAYYLFSAVVIYNLRSYIRSKYAIPESESCPTGCEDGCMALFCSCCTAAQMMRHTTEYDTYRAECFSATGLPDHVPALIV